MLKVEVDGGVRRPRIAAVKLDAGVEVDVIVDVEHSRQPWPMLDAA